MSFLPPNQQRQSTEARLTFTKGKIGSLQTGDIASCGVVCV